MPQELVCADNTLRGRAFNGEESDISKENSRGGRRLVPEKSCTVGMRRRGHFVSLPGYCSSFRRSAARQLAGNVLSADVPGKKQLRWSEVIFKEKLGLERKPL
jgi:hypothetical protein